MTEIKQEKRPAILTLLSPLLCVERTGNHEAILIGYAGGGVSWNK
jgi:hypothetical protein